MNNLTQKNVDDMMNLITDKNDSERVFPEINEEIEAAIDEGIKEGNAEGISEEDIAAIVINDKNKKSDPNNILAKSIQEIIDTLSGDIKSGISDGYHTFDELYEHRHALFGLICRLLYYSSWKSLLHNDGSSFDGFFIAGVEIMGKTITYHIPTKYWNDFPAPVIDRAPEWDGHTSKNVVDRLLQGWKL